MKSETYTEPCQTSKKDAFAKIVNSKNPLTSFTKYSNLDLWEGSEFTQFWFLSEGITRQYFYNDLNLNQGKSPPFLRFIIFKNGSS